MRQLAGTWILMSFALKATAQTNIAVDAAAGRHTIDSRIYGVNFASQQQLTELNVPLNRSSGNSETRYNWQQNSSNRASDWYFESLEGSSSPGGRPSNSMPCTRTSMRTICWCSFARRGLRSGFSTWC